MSVIIRLQNLPWSANALDIRGYFRGLAIPDGGVHIVGGEMGDAFIAFSSDEDARQAMMLDGKKLKEVQVRLFLSSRAEMQKVIETARQASLQMMQMQTSVTITTPQPPVISSTSLTDILSNKATMEKSLQHQLVSNQNNNRGRERNERDSKREKSSGRDQARSRSRTRSRDRRRSRSRDRSGNRQRRDRSRSRSRERRNRRKRSNSKERSRERIRDRRENRSRDKERDKNSRETNDRENSTNKFEINTQQKPPAINNKNELQPNKNVNIWNTPPPIQPAFQNNFIKGYSTFGNNQMFPVQNQPAFFQQNAFPYGAMQPQQMIPFQQQQPIRSMPLQQTGMASFDNNRPTVKKQINENKPEPLMNFQNYFPQNSVSQFNYSLLSGDQGSQGNSQLAFQNPYTKSTAGENSGDNKRSNDKFENKINNFSGIFNNSNKMSGMEEDKFKGSNYSDNKINSSNINHDDIEGHSIRVSNMCQSTGYSEIRRFFSGLHIANNGIKIINDKFGLRTGVANVRFVKAESVPKAFTRNGYNLKNRRVHIERISEQEFEDAIDSFKPARNSSRFEQCDDQEESNISSNKNINNEQKFKTICIEGLSSFTKEEDITKTFTAYNIDDILLIQNKNNSQPKCYVKFNKHEDAKRVISDVTLHKINNKHVYITQCNDEDIDLAKSKSNLDNNDVTMSDVSLFNEDQLIKNESKDNKNFNNDKKLTFDNNIQNKKQPNEIPSLLSLNACPPSMDIRRSDNRQKSRFSRPDDNNNKTKFALVKNCDYKSTVNDFMKFFTEVGITPKRVEIVLNHRKQPSGEVIIEFYSVDDAENSLLQSNVRCGTRSVRVELISENKVIERLGKDFILQQGGNKGMITDIQSTTNNIKTSNETNEILNTECTDIQNTNNNFSSNQYNNSVNKNINDTNRNNNPFKIDNDNNIQKKNEQSDRNDRRRSRTTRFTDRDNDIPIINNSIIDKSNVTIGNDDISSEIITGNASVEEFGKPDCVVGMENVPYKAQIEDILDFFKEFNIEPHQIIRRYNDDGTPTGDARVAFPTPIQARSAIEKKRNKKILNRTIYLSLV